MIREVLTLPRLGSMAPDEAAAMWIARRSGGAALDEEPVFREWLDAAAANCRAWEEAEAALRCFESSDDDELLQEMRRTALEARPDRSRRWAPVAAIAASLALVASASLLLVDRRDPAPAPVIAKADPLSRLGSPDFVTAKGEQKQISLPDGSRLTLDTDSAVDVGFSAGRRSLALVKGRALFDVESDPGRPFEVRAGDRRVVALGTRFDVRVDPERVRVTLFEGRVAISPVGGGDPVRLEAGQQFEQRGASARILEAAPAEDSLAWRQGLVMFEDETLGAATAELNRYSAPPLVVRDPGIAGLRISGSFKAGDPGRFARTVSTIHPVRVVRHADGSIELLPRG